MSQYKKRLFWVLFIILGVLVLDQTLKIWVKTNMCLYESIPIFSWFRISFIENQGMAFGLSFGAGFGKFMLSLLRIIFVFLIGYYIHKLLRKESVPMGVIAGLSLIFVGAIGNIIDGVFYGKLFSESVGYSVAKIFPEGGGYASWLHGKVVDMLYFPFFTITWPSWIPVIGGQPFEFFHYVFNIADSSIFCGVVYLLIFQYSYFADMDLSGKENNGKENNGKENIGKGCKKENVEKSE